MIKPKIFKIAVGIVTSIFAFYGLIQLFQSGPNTQSFEGHASTTKATIDSIYINGFGGDPAADYHFALAGTTYQGSSTSDTVSLTDLKRGDTVEIQYSTLNPSDSCICSDATPNLLMGPISFNYWAILNFLPLAVFIAYLSRKSKRSNRKGNL